MKVLVILEIRSSQKKLATKFLVLALAVILGCLTNSPALAADKVSNTKGTLSKKNSIEHRLANGIYLVARKSTNRKDIEPLNNGERLVINDYHYLEVSERQKPLYLAVKNTPFIPLILKNNPDISKDERGHAKLQLTLDKSQTEPLKNFTTDNCGKTIAIVIGGDTVSVHKIREPITGGAIQITRCTDNGCKALYVELSKK